MNGLLILAILAIIAISIFFISLFRFKITQSNQRIFQTEYSLLLESIKQITTLAELSFWTQEITSFTKRYHNKIPPDHFHEVLAKLYTELFRAEKNIHVFKDADPPIIPENYICGTKLHKP